MMMSVRLVLLHALHALLGVAAEPIVIVIAALRPLAGLTLGRQAAGDAPALRAFLAEGARAFEQLLTSWARP